jgi:hypothetical protein
MYLPHTWETVNSLEDLYFTYQQHSHVSFDTRPKRSGVTGTANTNIIISKTYERKKSRNSRALNGGIGIICTFLDLIINTYK